MMSKQHLIPYLRIFFILFSGMILVKSGYAQQVEGVITDAESGEFLPGVNVIIKGTSQGTATGLDGSYSLNVSSLQDTLIYSFVGYQPQEIPINGRTQIDVTLHQVAVLGDELVVVGYGVQQRETLTGSISKISGDAIAASPSPNVTATLAGRLPGLVVSQRTGEPGRENLNILIRGTGTFRDIRDNGPLIIIDGVQRSLIERLNPEDIESVTVLKDASAAIYGARAANGVILVTTKQGVAGRPVFNLSYGTAVQSPTKLPDMLDAVTFAEAFNEAEWYRQGRPETRTPFYSDQAIQRFRDGSDPVLYPNTDWVGEVLKPYSVQQRINLSANGGSENVRYMLSFGMMDQEGSFRNDPTHYRQYNVRTRVDADLTEDLTVGANFYAILNDRTYSHIDTEVNFVNILQANPTLVSRYPNGLIGPGRLGENPLLLDQRGYTDIEDTPLYSTFTATYNVPFVDGLRLEASYNYDLSNQFEKTFIQPYFFHEFNTTTNEYELRQGTGSATVEVRDTYNKWTTSMYNIRATYQTTVAQDHHVTLLMGAEQQINTHRWAQAYRREFVSPAIPEIDAGSTDPEHKDNRGSASRSAYNNYLGRLNYDFRSKYLLEFLFRYDGSQIFPEGKRYGFFPGISLGWRLSEESFIRDNLTFVDELKVRASYGQLGNDRVGQFQYLQAFSFGNNFVFGSNDAPGIFSNTMPNPNITWEVSEKTDIGLEATLWAGLLGIDLTLWTENRSNILAQPNLSVSRVFGFPELPDQNIGEVDNKGFELILSHRNSRGLDFSYDISANVAFARSEIVFMDEVPHPEAYQDQTGRPIGADLFYQADGIFSTQEELDSYPHGAGAQVGDIRVVDINGDGVIDARDRIRVDYSNIPEYVFGLTTDFRYRDFDLSLFFQGQTNAHVYDGTASALGGSDFANAAVHRATDRWTIDNPNGTMPRSDAWQPGATTHFLYDASFVRLKTAEIGYNLPESLIARIGAFDNARLYVSGFNLLTWAKDVKWADPELGGDFTRYPPLRIINMGINVGF